jgi:hypothetical protein
LSLLYPQKIGKFCNDFFRHEKKYNLACKFFEYSEMDPKNWTGV